MDTVFGDKNGYSRGFYCLTQPVASPGVGELVVRLCFHSFVTDYTTGQREERLLLRLGMFST